MSIGSKRVARSTEVGDEDSIIRGGHLDGIIKSKGPGGKDVITPFMIFTIGGEGDDTDDLLDIVDNVYQYLNSKLKVPFLVVPKDVTVDVIGEW
jgi:hypothetical protein